MHCGINEWVAYVIINISLSTGDDDDCSSFSVKSPINPIVLQVVIVIIWHDFAVIGQ